jgi:hypothetical protein
MANLSFLMITAGSLKSGATPRLRTNMAPIACIERAYRL